MRNAGASGVFGESTGGAGLAGTATAAASGGWSVGYGANGATQVFADGDTGWAVWCNGDVGVDGNLCKRGGSIQNRHPLDPANQRIVTHSSNDRITRPNQT